MQERRYPFARDRVPEPRRPGRDDGLDVDTGQRRRVQLVEQDRVSDGNGNGAAEGLERRDQRGSDGDLLGVQHALRRDVALLQRHAESDRRQHLVADPARRVRGDGQRGEKTRAGGRDGAAEDGWRSEVADLGDEGSGEDGQEGVTEEVGDSGDAGVEGGFGAAGLEPDGELVDLESEGGVEEEAMGAAGKSVAPENDGGRDKGLIAVAPLRDDEDGECGGRAGEEAYDARGVPRVRVGAVLHRLKEHDSLS